jgi:hypothetical protein
MPMSDGTPTHRPLAGKVLPTRSVEAERAELTRDLIPSPGWTPPAANPPKVPPSHGGGTPDGEGAPGTVGGGPGTVRPAAKGY